MRGRLLTYGASGFTGRLLARHARGRSADTVLAGRNRRRLQRMAQASGLPYRVLALGAALGDIAVVINAAGPFVTKARQMFEACLRTGTHYLDVSGERPVFEQIHSYDDGDAWCGFRRGGKRLSRSARRVTQCYLRLAVSHTGLVSRGSYTTMIGLLREGVTVRRDGRLCAVPAGQLERGFDYDEGERPSTAASWTDVFTAYLHHRHPQHRAVRASRGVGAIVDRVFCRMRLAPARKLPELHARFLPEGASEEQRAAPRVIVAEVEDQYRRLQLHPPDAYSFTALSALAIAERAIAGDIRTGFQTPLASCLFRVGLRRRAPG